MILVRLVFQARLGKANEVVATFKRGAETARQNGRPNVKFRLLTDLSGPFDTVVQEVEVESLAAWEQLRAATFSTPGFQEGQAAMLDLVEAGRTEFYTIEA